jgi:uncharacterized protein (UPF0276 family)
VARTAVRVGITLQPERRYLDLLAPLFDEADYVEVAPETLWRRGDDGRIVPNAFHDEFRAFAERTGKPFVAHGVGLSLGTVDPADGARLERWLARIALDHATFGFLWYTDHLGVTVLDGRAVTLPIALPMTDAMAGVVRDRLLALQRILPDVGFENSVFYFLLGDWLDEPAFFARILTRERTHLLLDLHNVFTMAVNLDADAGEYLERIDLSRVIEIHLSGGARSDPAWLPDGRTLRLDSHDRAIPEDVWALYERVAPRCPNLRGVTVERMEGTVDDGDVVVLRDELRRARRVIHGRG